MNGERIITVYTFEIVKKCKLNEQNLQDELSCYHGITAEGRSIWRVEVCSCQAIKCVYSPSIMIKLYMYITDDCMCISRQSSIVSY